MIVVMIVAMYFLMIRPQRRQQKKHQDTLNQLKKGDHVITIGRLHGVIDEINNEARTVTLDCDGIYLVFDMNAIATVTQRAAAAEVAPAATDTKSNSEAPASQASADEATDASSEAASAQPAAPSESTSDDSDQSSEASDDPKAEK
ncbi:preprotein translocase subunit YajC [Lactobacillus sp. CRM56-3]|uniref:Preprotein translocase subunit YajC n=1 Tax=Secundilactobacillus folii TaxID=2678357 RepID=A0A7X2XW50_9LACO|nr:preprotein translocase subunit YajC [Secundilactobacillus folii]